MSGLEPQKCLTIKAKLITKTFSSQRASNVEFDQFQYWFLRLYLSQMTIDTHAWIEYKAHSLGTQSLRDETKLKMSCVLSLDWLQIEQTPHNQKTESINYSYKSKENIAPFLLSNNRKPKHERLSNYLSEKPTPGSEHSSERLESTVPR